LRARWVAAAQVKEVYADSGLMGFWRGVLPSLLMVSNPAIQYMLFEWLRTRRSQLARYKNTLPSPGQVFCMGALAKMGATVVRAGLP
jgi:adenine nucleotide transporter 17